MSRVSPTDGPTGLFDGVVAVEVLHMPPEGFSAVANTILATQHSVGFTRHAHQRAKPWTDGQEPLERVPDLSVAQETQNGPLVRAQLGVTEIAFERQDREVTTTPVSRQ